MTTELTAAQRRGLRSMGRTLKPSVLLGKEGLSQAALEQVRRQLDRHELVKLKTLDACPEPIDELAERIAAETGAALVGLIGRTALLYRPKADLPADSAGQNT